MSVINKSISYIIEPLARKGFKYPEYWYARHLRFLLTKPDPDEDQEIIVAKLKEAAAWYEKAANKNITNAFYSLIFIYEQLALFGPREEEIEHKTKSNNCLIKSAESGHPRAQVILGNCYWHSKEGDSFVQDYNLAHDWFTLSARKYDVDALCNLGIMYYSMELINNTDNTNRKEKADFQYYKAYQYFTVAANLGSNIALCYLAKMYAKGRYVKKDLSVSYACYKEAAQNGSAIAMLQLAAYYEKGTGVTQSYTNALFWYTKAANDGSVPAKLRLADLYVYGHGTKVNIIKAELLLKSLAERGEVDAQFKLATLYDAGNNLQNYKKAHFWYLKAAKLGHTKAQINLAALYLKGDGVIPSENTAIFWLELAAQGGDQIAQYNLKQLRSFGLDKKINLNAVGQMQLTH